MLKFILDSLEGLDESTAALYKKDSESGKLVLQVEGAVSKARLAEFRDTNIELQKKLDGFKDVDPKKYEELSKIDLDELKTLRELKIKTEGKEIIGPEKLKDMVEERVKTMREEFVTNEAAFKTVISNQSNHLSTLLVDSAVRKASTDKKVKATAVDDVILRANSVFRVEDGVAIPYEGVGDDRTKMYGKTGEKIMTVSEWVEGLQNAAPHLFEDSTGGGSRTPNGSGLSDKSTPMQKIRAGLE